MPRKAEIIIPYGLMKAVSDACDQQHCYCDDSDVIVKAVLNFVALHPILPTIEEVRSIVDGLDPVPGTYTAIETIREWIGIMFYIGERIEGEDSTHGIQ
jgi:hypothetical protein